MVLDIVEGQKSEGGGPKMAKIHYDDTEKTRGPQNGQNSIWGKTGHL